jgi:hypothetical protein
MAEHVFDVVLQSTGAFDPRMQDWEGNPPPQTDFDLEDNLWLGRLPNKIKGETVFAACEPAGFEFHPIRQFGYRYALCRKVSPPSYGSEHLTWDHDGVIGRTLFLSRLIHPTTIASHYSARLFFEDDTLSMIVPGRVQGYATYVWIVAMEWRDWLSQSEAEQLRQFRTVYIHNAPDRVRRARSHIDHVFHAYYLDQRTASLVSAFESLLKVERNRATAQFKLRVPALAGMFGTCITADEAETVYDDRSVFVHGRGPKYKDVSEETMERYNKFETLLRSALLRASTDAAFANVFLTDASILSTFGTLP